MAQHREAKDTRRATGEPELHVRLLAEAEFAVILPLIRTLNPDIPPTLLAARLDDMRKNGYQCAGVFAGGRCVAVAGLWFGTRFWCGRYVDIDNVVVDESWRGRGIGRLLLDWVEAYARRQGCEKAVLDAYVTNGPAHAFYIRRGYRIVGFHFDKDLRGSGDPPGAIP